LASGWASSERNYPKNLFVLFHFTVGRSQPSVIEFLSYSAEEDGQLSRLGDKGCHDRSPPRRNSLSGGYGIQPIPSVTGVTDLLMIILRPDVPGFAHHAFRTNSGSLAIFAATLRAYTNEK
jgi:hypothetical protein